MGSDSNSPASRIHDGLGSFFNDPIGSTQDAIDSFGKGATKWLEPPKDSPKVANPAADPAPTLADATTTAMQGTLKQEQMNFWQRSNLTGGQGLLDTPKTASQTLLGS